MSMVSMDTTIQVLAPSGILDSTQSESIHAQVSSAIEAQAKTLLVDLKDTTFVDSSGLGTLVSALKQLRAHDCEMVICAINPQVKMLFELTSMDQVFEIYENREAFEAAQASLS